MVGASINGLIEDIEISIGLPVFVALAGIANSKLPWNRRNRGLRLRLVVLFAILAFLFCIITFTIQDREILIDLWRSNPIFYSSAYLLSALLCVLGVSGLISWKLRPKLWRDDSRS